MRAAPVLVALIALAGCKTAERAYREGMDLETSGRMEAASAAYADALRRDAGLANVRGRLVVASREAVRQRLGQAAAAPRRSEAADHFLAAEAVVRDAATVGVDAARPPTFEADVAAACAAAVDALLESGVARVDAREYAAALELLDRARRYRPSAEAAAGLDETARTAYTYWAEDDLDGGRFRAALAHADAALGLARPGTEAGDGLRDLRGRVLDAGTVVAAVFPAVEPRTPAGEALPEGLLRDATDVLLDDRLAVPPVFVALTDPAEARRLVRRTRTDLAGNPRELAALTRELGADVGLVAEVDRYVFEEEATGRRDVAFRRRDGSGTAPGVQTTTRMTLSVHAALLGVAADGTRIACDSRPPAVTVTEDVETAATEADVEALDLTREQRRWLDAERQRDEAYTRATARLRDALADALADRVTACLGRQVP